MIKSRILGSNMILLFFLQFLISKSQEKKAVGRFNRFFILNCILLRFLGEIVHRYQTNGMRGYLYQSCLLRRFLTLGYCSIPINVLGGESNDFNK